MNFLQRLAVWYLMRSAKYQSRDFTVRTVMTASEVAMRQGHHRPQEIKRAEFNVSRQNQVFIFHMNPKASKPKAPEPDLIVGEITIL